MHTFHEYLLSAHHIPGTVLGCGDSAVLRQKSVSSWSLHPSQFQEEPPRVAERRVGTKGPLFLIRGGATTWGCGRMEAALVTCLGHRESQGGISTVREEEEERPSGLL